MLNKDRVSSFRGWVNALVITAVWVWAQPSSSKPLSPQQQATDRPLTKAAESSGVELFTKHIRPVIEKHCLTCHSGDSRQSGLDLSTQKGLLRGGDRGPAIVVGDPKASLLYKLVAHAQKPEMPRAEQ